MRSLLFGIGLVLGSQLLLVSKRSWKDGRGEQKIPPGLPRMAAGTSCMMLVLALRPASQLAGWQPPTLFHGVIFLVGFAAAAALWVPGYRQSLRAMRARHEAELRALDKKAKI